MIGFQALVALSQQFLPELGHFLSTHIGHGHSHSHTDLSGIGPDLNAAWLAAGSILVKEYLYRATMRIAESQRSTVLAGNAYHHRVDCLTSIVALITILASRFATHAEWLDPVGGLLISGMIVQAGWGATRQALLELADVSVDDHVKDDVAEKVRSVLAAGGVGSLRGVQGVKSGQSLLMEVEIGVRRDASLGDLGDLEGKVREEVGTVSGVKRVVIRFVSSDGDEKEPFEDEFVESNGLSNGNEHGKKE
ncbi:hypothetical protein K470DRAFT_259214 [Piedraia hortae CBS 480.64]|uniref:Cation efflux protein transmembrane domain-containing protein n=1 Tax=Piedraia hortae CBS 480.64 TaxID=1314780 RepID=A0A6A7BV10_9PEZI|nr:hypothetical protein K470DRAFT_259214 [Piedraia hortae CBS 480.64]